MTDTRKNTRIAILFDDDIRQWLEDNHRTNGHPTLARFANSIISEYVKSRTQPPEQVEEGPLTPEEEVNKIVEEMGELNERYDEEFEAIRGLLPKDAPKVQTQEDLKKRTELIWAKLKEKNGFVRASRKRAVAISRQDLQFYEKLGMLHLRKRELERLIGVAAVAEAQ